MPLRGPIVNLEAETEQSARNQPRPNNRPVYTKYPPGTRIYAGRFPNYEGMMVELAICPTRPAYQTNADDQSDGRIRVTAQLPDLAAEPDVRQGHCPHCQRPFAQGIYLKPGKPALESSVYDRIFGSEADFERFLKEVEGKVIR